MGHDLRLLLRLRAYSWWNAVRAAPPAHKWVGGLLGVGSVALFGVIFAAFAALLVGVRTQGAPEGVSVLVERTVFFLFLFLLAGAIPFVSGVLLSPGDLPLLAASPVRPSAIVLARLMDAIVVSSGQFVVIGVPLLLASAWALFGGSAVGWAAFVLLLLLFLALPPLLVAAMLLFLARAAGLRRVRVAVAIASAVLSVALCLLTVSELSQRAGQAGSNGLGLAAVATSSGDTAPPPAWFPSTWVTDALVALGSSRPTDSLTPLVALLAVTVAAGALAAWLGGPVLVGESLLEGDNDGAGRGDRRSRLDAALSVVPIGPEARALIAKDLRYIIRDLVLLSQIGIPFILYFVPFVIGARAAAGTGSHGGADDLLLWLSLGIIGMIAYMVTSILSLSSVGLEGQGFWLVLAAPVSPGTLVRAKWLMTTGTSVVLTAPLLVASCVFYRVPLEWTLYGLLGLVVACGTLCGLGVGLAGLFPRFVYENPAHRASLSALIGGFVGATAYVLLSGVALGLAFFFAPQWPERSALIYAGGVGAFLLLSLLTGLLPLGLATARLDGYAWEG